MANNSANVNNDDKKKALDAAIAQIEKQYGKGSVMKLGSAEKMQVEVIPTGCLHLDFALGVGGLPKGRPEEEIRSSFILQEKAKNDKIYAVHPQKSAGGERA